MSQQTARRRARHLQIGIPAAVLSTLAGAFAASPAAASDAPTGALQRMHAVETRALPTAAKPGATHTVKQGETVWAIARKYGLRTADLLTWNKLGKDALIHPGQVLRLSGRSASTPAKPASSSTPSKKTHTVVAGDTVFRIAQKYGTTVSTVLKANGLSRSSIIYPGQKLRVTGSASAAPASTTSASTPKSTASSADRHTVAAGDTITAIAKKYGLSVTDVLKANGLSTTSIIYPGQKLVVKKSPTSEDGAKYVDLNAPQAENARMIIAMGRDLGVSERGIAIALATSMVESWLRNLEGGDRDSLGLFQQRPSTGWGTAEQIRHRDYAIRAFFNGTENADGTMTHGLLDVDGWESMRFTDAAQAVQKSAFPERYGQWEKAAYRWLEQYG